LGSDKKTIGFNDEYKEQLEKINDLFYRLFRKKGKIRKVKSPIGKKGSYTLEIRQYVINSFFHVVLRMIRGYKNHLEIPKLIIKNKPLLKNYLIGLYDADGTLPKNPETVKQNFIDVAVKSQHLMKQVKKAVESFGVLTLKLYPRKSRKCFCQSIKKESIIWELRIRRKKAIIRFLKEIGFNHPEKSKRALHLLKKMDP